MPGPSKLNPTEVQTPTSGTAAASQRPPKAEDEHCEEAAGRARTDEADPTEVHTPTSGTAADASRRPPEAVDAGPTEVQTPTSDPAAASQRPSKEENRYCEEAAGSARTVIADRKHQPPAQLPTLHAGLPGQ